MSSEIEKSSQDEMNEVWMESMAESIKFLIPEAWEKDINTLLPKLLNIVKIGMKKGMKTISSQLGNDIFMIMNLPVQFESGEILKVPHYVMISPDQINFFQTPTPENPNGEFKLKDGEVPKAIYSFATLAEKIQNYTDVKDIMKDIQTGNFMKFTFPDQNKDSQISTTE